MVVLPPSLTRLAAALNGLPGIGPRSAERLSLHLVGEAPEAIQALVEAIQEAKTRVRACDCCGALSEEVICRLCDDPARATGTVCLVETPVDVIHIERAGGFRGRYHVLGGRISPLDGVGPEDLRIAVLERRLEKEAIREVILALSSDVEGDATSHYLAKRLRARGVQVSKLAQGLPVGSGLEYADDVTLNRALSGRTAMDS